MTEENPRAVLVPAEALEHLRGSDPAMGPLLDRIGPLEYSVDADLWRSLVGSVVGQQLSVAAARTIRGRIAALGASAFPDPETILATSDETLRACGLSRAKLGYLRDLARAYVADELDRSTLDGLPDEEVIGRLVKIRGVGRWTAEMVLIFSLGRPDVLAVDDLGIKSAVQKLYGLPDRPGGKELNRQGEAWRPYRSYASLYLWRSLKSAG